MLLLRLPGPWPNVNDSIVLSNSVDDDAAGGDVAIGDVAIGATVDVGIESKLSPYCLSLSHS